MKKLLFIALLLPALVMATPQNEAHVIKEKVLVVPPNTTSAPIYIPVSGVLQSIKLCSSFDGPAKNVQVKAEIANVWFGSVSQDCTTLDQVGPVRLEEDAELRVVCKNFDPVKRTCRIKVVYYTKD
jgi:hypothetical protein